MRQSLDNHFRSTERVVGPEHDLRDGGMRRSFSPGYFGRYIIVEPSRRDFTAFTKPCERYWSGLYLAME
jgi:hypothetical protein